jgi:putative ABC transport system permease protein
MDQAWNAIHQTLRGLLKRPMFSAVTILTLALGIGANTAIFSAVNAVLLRQLPYKNAARTVWITGVRPQRSDASFSLPDFLDYRDHVNSLDSLSAVGAWTGNLTGQGDAEQITGARVSGNLFEALGVTAAIGRTLEPEDDRPESAPVVVITDALWQRRFGGDRNVIGKPLVLNGASYTLVGVLPPNFVLPGMPAEIAVPLNPDADPTRHNRNTVNFMRMVGRIRLGATAESAQAEMNALAARLRAEFPEANAQKIGVKLTPLREQVTGGYRRALWVLLAAVGFVLLIACANLANLNLVRASGRRREMSIRSALGATRWQVIKLLLLESALLAAAGGALGIFLSRFGVQGLIALTPASIPRAQEIALDASVLVFTVLISILAAVVTGLAPALSVSGGDLARQMNEGSRGSTEGAGGKALRTGFVIVEVALSLVLLAGAGVLLKSFSKVLTVDPGFDPRGVLAIRLSVPKNRYTSVEDVARFYDALFPRIRALPGVSAVGVTQFPPLSGLISSVPFTVVGRAILKDEFPEAQYRIVSPMYLRVMKIPLVEGREFAESDTEGSRLVCHVNETLAKRYWPGGEAVGGHLMIDDNNTGPREAAIVGVIHDVKDRGLETSPSFDIYIPVRQTHDDSVAWLQNYQYWVVRTQNDPLALADTFRAQVRQVDAEVAASTVRSMDQYYSTTVAPRRFNLQLFSIFAMAALALALAGIYGVISYSVGQRAHEIAIRRALGAQNSDVIRMVIAEGMIPVAVGLGLGLVGVFALTKELASLLFAVSASDPATLAVVTLLFCAVSIVAVYGPAHRATKIDPLAALRSD